MAEEVFLIGLIVASFRIATPLLLAATGELYGQLSGVLNLGVEGMMIMGALASFLAALVTGNYWLALLIGLITGGAMALVHAYMSISLKVDQVISGLALTILGLFLSQFVYIAFLGRAIETIEIWAPTPIPILSQIPIIGPSFFSLHFITYFAIIMSLISIIFVKRTTWGLAIRAVGQNARACDTLGIRVMRLRYLCVIFGGFMAGLGGAFLTLAYFNTFFTKMTAGRGWIALAIVVFSRWRPSWVLVGGLFFGFLDSFQLRLQASGLPIPFQFSLMFPYLLTLIALVVVSRRQVSPAELTKPFIREKH